MKPSRVATRITMALIGAAAVVAAAAVICVRDWDLHDELQLAWMDES